MPSRCLLPAMLAALGLAACGHGPQGGPPPTPTVTVIRLQSQPLPLVRDLVGRLASVRTADVRARVPGVLLRRLYTEGSEVREGQPLFQIDPQPYEAALDAAGAALVQAQANAANAHAIAERARRLAPSGLMSQQDVDTALANERSTTAQVRQAAANLHTARINLGYARVTAPIAGHSGQQRVTEGALVGQGDVTLLTTIDQIDRLYVNFDRPADDLLRLQAQQASGEVSLLDDRKVQLTVLLPDGAPYPLTGHLDFSDVSVDPSKATLAFRGIIDNPRHQLLPGMFVNIRLLLGRRNHAFRVPQAVVRRDGEGAYVELVDRTGRVERRYIQADVMDGTDWIVERGLADGEQVIASGIDRLRPGQAVRAVPAATAPGR